MTHLHNLKEMTNHGALNGRNVLADVRPEGIFVKLADYGGLNHFYPANA